MTREEILRMEPGPELARLVAERVMGWHLSDPVPLTEVREWLTEDGRITGYDWCPPDSPHYLDNPFEPSTDIAAAWEVVQHLMPEFNFELFSTVDLEDLGKLLWAAEFRGRKHGAIPHTAKAETAPLAICRAALLAVTQENGGTP